MEGNYTVTTDAVHYSKKTISSAQHKTHYQNICNATPGLRAELQSYARAYKYFLTFLPKNKISKDQPTRRVFYEYFRFALALACRGEIRLEGLFGTRPRK